MPRVSRSDVAIVGGGVAGIAAAAALRDAGARVVLLEARDRIGGRILTLREPDLPVPLELGAEFLHGDAPEVGPIARRARLTRVAITGDRWRLENGRLARFGDFWERLSRVLGGLDEAREPDRSFADYLAARRGASPRDRRHAKAFVEGFHAADASRIGERTLAAGEEPGATGEAQTLGRLVDGYDGVPAALAAPVEDSIRLGTVVERVEWSRGRVRIGARDARGRALRVAARAAIVTVPLGVLRTSPGARGGLALDPEPPGFREALAGLAMGSVVRVVVVLREPIWRDAAAPGAPKGALEQLSFLHAPALPIPVWWTLFPVDAPVVVGWAGGPAADRLAVLPSEELERLAVDTLARALAHSRARVRRAVRRVHAHDWIADPFSRGAYSYALVGGSEAPRRLGRPALGTLVVAGEATAPEGGNATVDGAIAEGRRAARAIARALG